MTRPTALHVFSTFAVGGPQTRFAAIANSLGTEWRHMIVAMDGDIACREKLAPGLDVSFPTIGVRKGDTLGNVRAIRGALRAWRPDVLVTSNFGTIEWAMANVVPLVRHVHMEDGFGPDERERQLPRRVWLRRMFLRRALVIVPSAVLLRIATDVWRLPAARLRHVPNGIDLSRFATADRDWRDPPVIGTVAALRAEKNIARLIRAFALLRAKRAARLVIAGDGPEMAALRSLAATAGCGGDVSFIGHEARPERAYPAFDVFALSSDTEQMPLSVLEAMASGLAVAATDVGDVRAMLAEENAGCVVPREDAALAAALERLLEDPAAARRIGAANRARAEAVYDDRRMFATHVALWRGDAPG